jgi:hypothetical protein
VTPQLNRKSASFQSDESGIIVNRGKCIESLLTVNYTTSQPAPRQWIAMGIISLRTDKQFVRLLVGVGRAEDEAVADLTSKLNSFARSLASISDDQRGPQPEQPRQIHDITHDAELHVEQLPRHQSLLPGV